MLLAEFTDTEKLVFRHGLVGADDLAHDVEVVVHPRVCLQPYAAERGGPPERVYERTLDLPLLEEEPPVVRPRHKVVVRRTCGVLLQT